MRTFNGLDELKTAVGEHLGTSEWHEITQKMVDQFADATGDHQWIHVDPERAKDGPFGGTIAHGYLTLSLVPSMVWQVYELTGVSAALNYGSNKVRFPTPVPVGSRVRGHVTISGVERNARGANLLTTVTVELEGAAKPACVAETVTVVIAG